ncbi:hypothetical protein DYB36_012990 [Aphanomyces astaci]|uniref:Uncharacterized protein n=1 Tax=Aphanomyces astaci TaxID=112090 RepID=A0A397A4I9_APHAT|nr:hypothetical protein DYB36_012990 [Aphanomyces astaci]
MEDIINLFAPTALLTLKFGSVLRPEANSIALDDHIFVDDANYSSVLATAVGVSMPPLYVSQIKLADATKLAAVVRGLRHVDAYLAPWIATQYVDGN